MGKASLGFTPGKMHKHLGRFRKDGFLRQGHNLSIVRDISDIDPTPVRRRGLPGDQVPPVVDGVPQTPVIPDPDPITEPGGGFATPAPRSRPGGRRRQINRAFNPEVRQARRTLRAARRSADAADPRLRRLGDDIPVFGALSEARESLRAVKRRRKTALDEVRELRSARRRARRRR